MGKGEADVLERGSVPPSQGQSQATEFRQGTKEMKMKMMVMMMMIMMMMMKRPPSLWQR
jgi:hypothetical protein